MSSLNLIPFFSSSQGGAFAGWSLTGAAQGMSYSEGLGAHRRRKTAEEHSTGRGVKNKFFAKRKRAHDLLY